MEQPPIKKGIGEDKLLFACLTAAIILLIGGASLPYFIQRSDVLASAVSRFALPALVENTSETNAETQQNAATTATSPQNSAQAQAAAAPSESIADQSGAGSRASLSIGDPSLAAIDFDLSDQSSPGGGEVPVGSDLIEVRKSLITEGKELGSMTVTIDQNARIFVRGQELQTLLNQSETSQSMPSRLASNELVSFQQVRDAGIDIRYDPIDDRIVLHP
ncbi:hypothetical protein [Erythrobacter rubeus]|uniref:Copper amine oxidase-like N-terminal domain-containing protein n=1 Tax=Erythrobacter rubeus TaxID=2760803 RepID=A0ABR8KQ86_9SPHN|nr:hypothetical protein [Erythrobacter rubeus]MBD2841203.1 hypothetical protein [Erythrobacter rubeus]